MRISFKTGIIIFILLPVFFILICCERKEPSRSGDFNCAECFQDKPEWGPLNIILSTDGQNPYIPLTIYIGNIEDSVVDWVDTAYSNDFWIDVQPDRYYSVAAEYKQGDNTIIVVDGDKLNSKYSSSDCEMNHVIILRVDILM